MKPLYYLFCCFSLLVVSCGAPSSTAQNPSLTLISPTPTIVSPVTVIPTDQPTAPLATATPSPASNTQFPTGWYTIEWEGLRIPLPPQAAWQPNRQQHPPTGGIPVLAGADITYPTITGIVELPYGPGFTILKFSGSLEEWIDREQQREQLAVNPQTIQDTTVAGRPAKVYQPVVTGTCNIGYYIVALDRDRLLWIWTDCLEEGVYDEIIKGIQVVEP